jgi:hypothetical protein
MIAINRLLTLVILVGTSDGGEPPADCAEAPRLLKEQEDRHLRIIKGLERGDELAEGRKIDALRWKLRQCGAGPETGCIAHLGEEPSPATGVAVTATISTTMLP